MKQTSTESKFENSSNLSEISKPDNKDTDSKTIEPKKLKPIEISKSFNGVKIVVNFDIYNEKLPSEISFAKVIITSDAVKIMLFFFYNF